MPVSNQIVGRGTSHHLTRALKYNNTGNVHGR